MIRSRNRSITVPRRAVTASPFSTKIEVLFAGKSDLDLPVLVALTQPYARLMAGALDALGDAEVIFVTNVPGVMAGGAVAPHLSAGEVTALIADGTLTAGGVAIGR